MSDLKKDQKNLIKRGGSVVHGTATYTENSNSPINDDTSGNGRGYVGGSLENSVKDDLIKSRYFTAPATESFETTHRQSNHSGSPQRHNERHPSERLTSTQQRIYSTPEQTTSSSLSLNGAASTATYLSTTEKVIKDDISGIGREYVRSSLESSVKNSLIRNNGYSQGGSVPIIEPARSNSRVKAENGGMPSGLNGSAPAGFRPESEAKSSAGRNFSGSKTQKGLVRLAAGHTYRSVVNATAQNGQAGGLGDRTAGHSIKYLVRTPRYTKNTAAALVGAGRNLRYTSKLLRDAKAGIVTGKETSLAVLKRNGSSLKVAGVATLKTLGRTAEDFYGSDDLGIEAVRKPKDTIVATNRLLKVTSRAAKALVHTPQKAKRTLRNMQKTAQRAQQAAKYATTGIKAILKVLSKPVVLKSLAIAGAIVAVIIVLMVCVSSIAALFSSFTYPANDVALTDAYTYVTELDTDLAKEIRDIPGDPIWAAIDKFSINAFEPMTDPIPITSYLSVRYEDFKFNDVKGEIEAIHKDLYHLNYYQWTETIPHHETSTNPDGTPSDSSWNEYIEHLDVTLEYKPFQEYVNEHKEEMFPKIDDYARYETYNKIGGTSLRAELGFPFPGKTVYISSRYGWRLDPVNGTKSLHSGIDIPMEAGTPVNATMGGTVTTGYDSNGYGNYVVITSGNRKTLYGHCSSLLVSNGQTVTQGQEIARVGSTGKSTVNHLHLEFEKSGKKLNPFFYIEFGQFISGINGGLTVEALGDGQFAALIAEAEKYLGFPYVFGGKTPSTSFDCSGFVSWVLTHSGVKSISASAQGLYNNCTPISETELKPGDLIFFQGTYACPNIVTHVAFYVGNGTMLHCGDPIQYTSFKTSYWQNHFYSYGRINK